jgi:hypothetical protein
MLRIEMDIDLTRYTEDELVELNRRIVERIRLLRQGRCQERMAGFNVGDRVSFQPERGLPVEGTVIRLNSKSVTVVSTDGVHWRVSPGLLERVGDEDGRRQVEGGAQAKVQADLIDLAERRQRDRGKA